MTELKSISILESNSPEDFRMMMRFVTEGQESTPVIHVDKTEAIYMCRVLWKNLTFDMPMEDNGLKVEAIKGLNSEKVKLTDALATKSHNESIKIASRLREIDVAIRSLIG